MNYIHITKENLDKEHICCAMSGKQSLAKKEWLRQRFDEGLVFYRSEERGKCFIEYIPAENAWVPIEAAGYLYINCLWIAGAMKGHGPFERVHPGGQSAGKERRLHSVRRGTEAGISRRPEVSGLQGLPDS